MIGAWLNGSLRRTNQFPQTIEVNIAIRTDASSVIGSGHLMRCLAIADELKNRGVSVLFITVSEEQKWIDLIRSRGFTCEIIEPAPANRLSLTDSKCNETNTSSQHYVVDWRKDSSQTREIIEGKEIDWLIVDHYGLDWQWESSIRDCVNRILVIDDLADRAHDCDVLLDCVYGRTADDYKSLVPRGCELLLGTKYAPLRPEFMKWRESALERRRNFQGVNKILVSLGGTDKSNLTGEVLNQLTRLELSHNIEIEVVVGLAFLHLNRVEDQIASLPNKISLDMGANNMASRIVEADLGIGAIGVSTWERFCLGLPAVNLITETHQLAVVASLREQKFSGVLHSSTMASELAPFLKKLIFDQSYYRNFSNQCSRAIDGKGLFRNSTIKVERLKFIVIARRADMRDCKEVFEWRNDSITMQMSSTSDVVLWEDHLRWYERSLANEKRLLLICESKEKVKSNKLGIVRFDFVDDGRESEISINLSPSERGKGYGKECLKKAIFYMVDEWPMCKLITAKVKKINDTSKRVFEQVGFNVVAEEDLFWKFELPCLELQ